ncbi:hypothetical protein ABEB36_013065 [Hypothenemus hampei]|uniref:C2H2-type domain-containing protein n=1 Tax=Hypothenemus hampei TaxID=57062 RepID=A0ABD1E9F2_HYPHA
MSIEKKFLRTTEEERSEEEIGNNEEDEKYEEAEDCDEEEEAYSCKYCEYVAPTVEDLDDHIITHDEAITEDSENSESEVLFEEGSENSEEVQSASEESSPVNYDADDSRFILGYEPPGRKPKQRLPAFYSEFVDKPDKRVFVCPFCGYQTMKKTDLNRHLKGHQEPVELPLYICSECPYTTRRKYDMPKHLLTHCKNGTVPMYSCNDCSYITKRKGDLVKHMLCHGKPNTVHHCTQCPYTSKRQGDLKKHIASHENDSNKERVLNCSECGYTSKRLNDLHKHVVLHCDRTVKGAFKCPKCDYASLASSPFARHVLSNCKLRDMAVSIFPKENSMQEYIVLDEEELHLYDMEKEELKVDGSRKRGNDGKEDNNFGNEEKRVRYNDVQDNKVVVVTGYEENEG